MTLNAVLKDRPANTNKLAARTCARRPVLFLCFLASMPGLASGTQQNAAPSAVGLALRTDISPNALVAAARASPMQSSIEMRLPFAKNWVAGLLVGVSLTIMTLTLLAAAGCLHVSFRKIGEKGRAGAAENGNVEAAAPSPTTQHLDEEHEDLHMEFWPRCGILAVMLCFQSLSSYILADFGGLIRDHPHLIIFLTMLVGLGGNAGGQSVVLAVRRLALGQSNDFGDQARTALLLAIVLGPLSYFRAAFQKCSTEMAMTIALSAASITVISVGLGTVLPSLLQRLGADPAHSAPMIQVAMDMIGISVVCVLGTLLLGPADT